MRDVGHNVPRDSFEMAEWAGEKAAPGFAFCSVRDGARQNLLSWAAGSKLKRLQRRGEASYGDRRSEIAEAGIY
jgi:hypothetical protein